MMFYTVIQMSGWQGDTWSIAKTCASLKEAREYQESIKSSDPKSDGYNTRIMRHRKNLVELWTEYHIGRVQFNDGTVAYESVRDYEAEPAGTVVRWPGSIM